MNAVELKDVEKRYGSTRALSQLSFQVPKGSVTALIGPNGAGKTTAMGVIAGLLRPSQGQVDLLGQGAFAIEKHAGRIGIMPQDSTPSEHASIGDSLRFYAQLQGMEKGEAEREVAMWLQKVHLTDRARAKYGALSHGMRRRFSLAQAMLGRPELVLLDEPTSGLDPELVVEIRNVIVDLRGTSTVLVSSHILSELEAMCDHAVFIENGTCTRQGAMAKITGRDAVVRYRLSKEPDLKQLAKSAPEFDMTWSRSLLTVRSSADHTVEDINAVCLRAVLDAGVGILEVQAGESLESAYLAKK